MPRVATMAHLLQYLQSRPLDLPLKPTPWPAVDKCLQLPNFSIPFSLPTFYSIVFTSIYAACVQSVEMQRCILHTCLGKCAKKYYCAVETVFQRNGFSLEIYWLYPRKVQEINLEYSSSKYNTCSQ